MTATSSRLAPCRRRSLRWPLGARLRAQTLGKGGSMATGGAGPTAPQARAPSSSAATRRRARSPSSSRRARSSRTCSATGSARRPALIRMMVQQSNCFQVVERGVGMRQHDAGARARRSRASCRPTQNIGKGQMVGGRLHRHAERSCSARTTPAASAARSAACSAGAPARVLGGIAGGLKFKQARDQHAARRRALGHPGRGRRRQRAADRLRARRHAVRPQRRCRRSAATATPTRAR